MSLTGLPLVIILAALTAALPIGWAIWSVLRPVPDRPFSRVRSVGLRTLGVAVCQLVLVSLVFVVVNRGYGFFASWSDLAGTAVNPPTMQSTKVTPPPGDGKVLSITVHGEASKTTAQVMVWLPPQYFLPAEQHHRFPVLMVLPSGSQAGAMNGLEIIPQALRSVREHKMHPFIAVTPPITTLWSGVDTECIDLPGGPLAASWLTHDVRSAVVHTFRASASARNWSLTGFSLGAYCATNLYLHHRTLFGSAVSFGGYFAPDFNHTSDARRRAAQKRVFAANSPLTMFRDHPPATADLLLVASSQDPESWQGASYADGQKMADVARKVSGTTVMVLAKGGHHYRTYTAVMPQVMTWLGRHGL